MPYKKSIILKKGEGRKYNMGSMQAVFLADEQETEEKYSVSEWWLDAESTGPAGTIHDFANRTGGRTGVLNFFIPGGF